MSEANTTTGNSVTRFCIDCRHQVQQEAKYLVRERCVHPMHGRDVVTGQPIQTACRTLRNSTSPSACGSEARHFEKGEAPGATALALSALPQDLFRTLQRAASCLDLDVNGLTAAEVVDRYTALGAQITPDFAARILREGTNTGTCDADVAIPKLDQGKLPVGREVNDSASGHERSVSNAEGGAQ